MMSVYRDKSQSSSADGIPTLGGERWGEERRGGEGEREGGDRMLEEMCIAY